MFFEIKYKEFNSLGAAMLESMAIDRKPEDKFVLLMRGWENDDEYIAFKEVCKQSLKSISYILDPEARSALRAHELSGFLIDLKNGFQDS